MSEKTSMEILKTGESTEPTSTLLNIHILFDAMEKKTPKQREAIRNFILGCASQAIPAAQWKEIVDMALKSAADSEGRII